MNILMVLREDFPPDVSEFKEAGLTPLKSDVVKAPLVAESPMNMECKLVQTIPLGAHDLFLGEVVAVHVDEAVLDDSGHRIDYGKARPFVLTFAEYRGLGEAMGNYGFSVKKQDR